MVWQPNKLEQERLEKANQLEALGVEIYPRRVERTHRIHEALALLAQAEGEADSAELPPLRVTVCGRIRRVNLKGKLTFMDVEDETGRIQLFLRVNDMDESVYALVKDKLIDVDDYVQAGGILTRTKTGEPSVLVSDFKLLAKSLSPLPVIKLEKLDDGTVIEHGEFTDKETRYRQRYADLAVHDDVREVFRKRAGVISAMRRFLDDEGMLEVETPVLQPIYGGAAARPFTTYHNHLEQELYLRISFELYLKRLLVGGFDAVYEIGRDFRNEGVSYKHNPEFTMMEFYKAYADYRDVMDIVERMMKFIAKQVNGSTALTYGEHTIDIGQAWQKITMRESIKQYAEIDYMDYRDAESLTAAIRAAGGQVKDGLTWGKLVEHLFSEYVEPKLIHPTFVLDYPRDISPFAKRVDYDDFHTERFEVYIAGMEIGNAFTELNNPLDQEQRFLDMAALYRDDDDDATPLDEDYLRAMRYGMPPCGGFGIGVDRVVMLMTNQHSIRDVLLFPHMRDQAK